MTVWVKFSIDDVAVVVKVPAGKDEAVLELADKRFRFNGTDEQLAARRRACDEMLAKRAKEKRDARR